MPSPPRDQNGLKIRSRSLGPIPGPESDLQEPVAVRRDDGVRCEGALVVDSAPSRFFREALESLLEQPLHLHLVILERELVGLHPREVEEVADEPGQAVGLGSDDRERCVPGLSILGEAFT